ncbi:MtrAB system histidine kinase MtrB [Brachybacterium alimentarium]|uniref:Sensor histidine kinase MtrB n=1 Tax=Brachybacterium alimentarium TaxID=47845 RepID=A0A2A3YIN2_9MICO|nr:MtrAB system histidine kinase MtrB [Brachybacterium alimentarium]PCC39216.1 two-component sensor histidine kinase [Brachybacterium alimentarium]RCS66529.1 HAMP domain-containing protein [Brachybacterium alimentarium]RCS67930.1 HAMP domain-containing protein [Brachybacterium alimentarium]RCS80937.1 HAMP domain-containing protein [Brachybacterium alimentarium]RCS82537.1 HAMP domain-containing protein [Brachybacterium alimentarium]
MSTVAEGAAEVPASVRLARAADPRGWPLALRVVLVTTLLSILAMLAVGAYLSSVIADGLYEQRRDRVLEETVEVRRDLSDSLTQLSSATSTQRQDAVNAFVQSAGGQGGGDRREVALLPVETSETVFPVASSDRTLFDEVDDEFSAAVAASPDSVSWRSIGREDPQGRTVPALLVGTRVMVPGVGSYDLYLVYSMQEEQETLGFVQSVLFGGGGVLLALVVGIAIAVARLVTTPLKHAARAAERIAGGDLDSRVEVSGADELARVGESFNDMARSLAQKVDDLTELSRLQQRFVSDVSHELRTPLTTIRMASSVLDSRRPDLPGDLQRTAELLSAQVERFDVLLADLLEISRFDAGAAELEAHREDLDALVVRAIDDVRPLAGARGCLLDVHLAGREMSAVVDARRVDRVLRNLLTNAIEHGAGGPVLVQTSSNEDSVAVVVQDYGHGISPKDAQHVFDRFWRADPSRARTLGGTGLGLSISAEDARLHTGWLQAWGQEGRGAVFRLTLPRRPGGTITRSPLRLERRFDRDLTGTYSVTPTGEIPIGPGNLPDLSDAAPDAEPEGENPMPGGRG